jgi:hypothetical protein
MSGMQQVSTLSPTTATMLTVTEISRHFGQFTQWDLKVIALTGTAIGVTSHVLY